MKHELRKLLALSSCSSPPQLLIVNTSGLPSKALFVMHHYQSEDLLENSASFVACRQSSRLYASCRDRQRARSWGFLPVARANPFDLLWD